MYIFKVAFTLYFKTQMRLIVYHPLASLPGRIDIAAYDRHTALHVNGHVEM